MLEALNKLDTLQGDGMIQLDQTWNRVKTMTREKDDFLVNHEAITMFPDQDQLQIRLGQEEGRPLTKIAHRQMGTHLNIPAKYYDRLQDVHPQLLAFNVNELLRLNPEQKRMVRTLDGQVRALLSDRYQIRDNFDLLEAILPTLLEKGSGYQVMSANVDENRLYLKFISREVHFDLSDHSHKFHKSDVMFAGLCISNNEVGHGSTTVEPFFFNSWCNNTAIQMAAFTKYHVGRAWDPGDEVTKLFKDETRKAADQVFYSQVKDVVEASFDQATFSQAAQKWIEAKDDEISQETTVQAVVEKVADKIRLGEDEKAGVIDNLIRDAGHNGLNRYALASAVTAQAHKTENYDRKTDLEKAGASIIDLAIQEWHQINQPDVRVS